MELLIYNEVTFNYKQNQDISKHKHLMTTINYHAPMAQSVVFSWVANDEVNLSISVQYLLHTY